MKKKFFIAGIALVLLGTLLWAQKSNVSLEKRWEKVNELAEKQLPESALKEVEAILKQAQKEKNSQQVIKAMVYKMRFTLEKNTDEAPALIKQFEAFTDKSTDPAERALLHSMTAELYAQYYQKDQWTINQRTELKGEVPEDMKEWTKNIFFEKVSKHLAASLENSALLQKTDALKFSELMEKGEDSRSLQPTLFDFVAYRRIELLKQLSRATTIENPLNDPIYFSGVTDFCLIKLDTAFKSSVANQVVETYQQLLAFRAKDNNAPALLYTDLQRFEYVKERARMAILLRLRDVNQSVSIANYDSIYLAAMNRLEKQFSMNEAVVEVLAKKADYYLNNYNSTGNATYRKKAHDICTDGINRFPKYMRIGLLRNIQQRIAQKELNVDYKKVTKRNTALKIKINSRNITSLQLTVYRVKATAVEYSRYRLKAQGKMLYPKRSLVESKLVSVKPDMNFGTVTTEVVLKPQDYGIYEFCIEMPGNEKANELSVGTFTVSDFSFIKRMNTKDQITIYSLDRLSGNPIGNAQVKIFRRKWTGDGYRIDSVNSVLTDQNGFCTYQRSEDYTNDVYFFKKGKDVYFSSDVSAYFQPDFSSDNSNVNFEFFTDRSIYRPGQTAYFKGIAWYANKSKQEVAPNKDFEVCLFDANGQKVSSKKFKTNEFGSLSGEFVLPEGGLNGFYRLQTENGYHTFRVEEYKRPTFEVKMEKPKAEVQFGDKVTLTGTVKAYAGYQIGNADVKYRVVRRVHHFCWWFDEPDEEIANGSVKSDASGNFKVSFIDSQNQNTSSRWGNRAYTYTVYADVTDLKGETQQGEQYVSVGDQSLFIITGVPEKIDKNANFALNISTQTINDEVIHSTVQYTLSRLAESDKYTEELDGDIDFKVLEQVMSGSFETRNKTLSLVLSKLNSGRYKFVFTTKDAHGKEVKVEKVFVLYGAEDKRPPVKSYVWVLAPKTKFYPGEIANIQFGTSAKNTSVLYEVMQGNTILESRWLTLSDEIKTFDIPFKEEYGAGVTVMFTFLKDEQLFTRSVQLTRNVLQKKLTPTLSVFRNKLLPGEKAEWTVTIPETIKDKKMAELLVGMYDASLDAIAPHQWYFNPVIRGQVFRAPIWSACSFDSDRDYVYYEQKIDDVVNYQFDALNWFGVDLGNGYIGGYFITKRKGKRGSMGIVSIADVKGNDEIGGKDIADVKEMTVQLGMQTINNVDEELQGKISGLDITNQQLPATKLRTNFNETAFFYPQLRTDENGNVKFSFTVPESLTRWNVKMLAHTKDLYFGMFDTTAVTQKDLMVQMNLPRFVRRSDKLTLSANLVNLTDQPLSASVQFELIDPASEKPIKLKDSAPKQVTLATNETKAVEWEVSEFSSFDLVTCKVVARAGNFSDGEQKYLPVLPDKVLVTESLPLTIRGNQTRTFNFESLIKNASNVDTKNLTLEFSANPAWYAVQALPTVAEPHDDNAIDLFAAYYANSLATWIANSTPKLATMFERWKQAGGSREALLSNLQKNAELKNMLLEETPWVMAARDETEQKRQIALLFDLNMQKNKNQQYWDKLLKLQLPSGGFTWFAGMPESRYITQEIMLNLGRLNRVTNSNLLTAYRLPLTAALKYLDLEIAKDFTELKKYNKNYQKENCVGNMQLFYLHVRSEFRDVPVDKSAVEAVKYYTEQSEKYWTGFTLYGKAMMAVVAQRNGKTQVAAEILKSLKENALKTDELGMYWARNTAGYFWHERPIAVQAAIIEAFREISNNTADIDELKIWLLKQKQTQRWDSPLATVDAIYALLNSGSDWLASDGKVEIKVGNTTLKPEMVEAGTGYFKQSLPTDKVTAETGKITVKKSDAGIGWGAMYWQFYQDLDKVSGQSGSLKVTKKLFVEKMQSNVKTLVPITQTEIRKGDRVITRLVVTTDRDLEFVALKDLRAACFEPVDQVSGCHWKEGVCYYQTTKDASTQFFFSFLPKGTYVFEYPVWANNSGEYTSGITTIQCQYAPEFVSHTGGERIMVK